MLREYEDAAGVMRVEDVPSEDFPRGMGIQVSLDLYEFMEWWRQTAERSLYHELWTRGLRTPEDFKAPDALVRAKSAISAAAPDVFDLLTVAKEQQRHE